ncbi:hypothetical protein Hypma_011541 [Hypsizygus marmoreus]|uniref:Sfi1 spindle body domain-containing protein n=1 Tax=Hypsizygus marmoreus TaxID=39966 RepID=A0A369JRM8_HYPMA|nr:hypothetical protein Hypma_011541 [Hypsizygus marmoreus]
MSNFRPTRASPPAKFPNLADRNAPHKPSADISRSSVGSVPELMGLSRDEIDLLDAVIERAGPSATTFLTVFKAYNDVLSERGLDPHEVLYYGKLLKVGTMKGKNWGEKWSAVKSQYNRQHFNGSDRTHLRDAAPKDIPKSASRRVIPRSSSPRRTDDTFTLHSHENESEANSSNAEHDPSVPLRQYHRTTTIPPRHRDHIAPSEASSDTGFGDNPLLSTPTTSRTQHRRPLWEAESTDVSESYVPSTTPPSYRAATHDVQPPKDTTRRFPAFGVQEMSPPAALSSATARKVVAMARERRGSVVNDDEAWKRIRMQRDEAEADQFRKDRLLERCWEVWKQGFQWIIKTNEQIGEARDNLLLRLSLQRWRNMTASRRDLYRRVTNLSDKRRLKVAINIWRAHLKNKQQHEWRNDMRLKMKTIREKRELKLRKDAWAKWRQSYRSHLSEQRYAERLVFRFYDRWKSRLSAVVDTEATADEFFKSAGYRAVERSWNCWRKATELRALERVMSERVELRLMGQSMVTWQKNMHRHDTANHFHRLLVLKTAIRSWKAARDRIQAMEKRATKHVARQDDVLLRAVTRVWKARERGKLLERVKAARLIKDAYAIWLQRRQGLRDTRDLAVAFSSRLDSKLASFALGRWRDVLISHQNSLSFAVQYDSAQLRYKMLWSWRIQLRKKIELVKRGRIADKIFTIRRAWRTWREVLDAKSREKRAEEFKRKRLERILHAWLDRTRKQKRIRLAEQVVKDHMTRRILKDSLSAWTNRVIEIKLREIEVAQRYEAICQTNAFERWKAVCVRHAEDLRLMESYQFVKREEYRNRLFNRWLNLARITRHRRITLKEKEDEMKFSVIASAWDKWRDRFSDERLRPIEYSVIIQTQKNVLFRAFGIWHSKTKSLPAIRFHATNLKSKYFEVWRRSLPMALQAKQAREKEKKSVLSKYLDKWVQTHRTKLALKAVARARYLRLPTVAPRQTRPSAQTTTSPTPPIFPRSVFPRPRTAKSESSSTHQPADDRPDPLNLLRTQSRPEKSPSSRVSVPRTRESSPTRSRVSRMDHVPARDPSPTRSAFGPLSSAGGDEGRSRLWRELREVQRKSQPSSQHSRNREPP